MKNKEYSIPLDLADKFDKVEALYDLRNSCVESLFWGYKRAKKASIEYVKLRRKFWLEVAELYPELEGKNLNYDSNKLVITIK